MSRIFLYAESAYIEPNGSEYIRVHLDGIDLSEVVAEAGTTELLENMDYADVVNWVHQKQQEDRDDIE